MLRNQTFYPPLEVAIGPELFFALNPLAIDLKIVRFFQKLSMQSVGLSFSYLSRRDYQPTDSLVLLDRLKLMNVRFNISLFFDDQTQESFLRETLNFFDVLCLPETLLGIAPVRGLAINDKGHFLSCLDVISASIVAPSVDLFRNHQLLLN